MKCDLISFHDDVVHKTDVIRRCNVIGFLGEIIDNIYQ